MAVIEMMLFFCLLRLGYILFSWNLTYLLILTRVCVCHLGKHTKRASHSTKWYVKDWTYL